MTRFAAAAAVFVLVIGLAACMSADKPKPTPLESIAAPKSVARLAWTSSFDRVDFVAAPAAGGSTVAMASGSTVALLRADNGSDVWRTNVGSPVVAGTGNDGQRVAVVTAAGELVVVEAGQVRWREPLPMRVATAPLVAGERVFVLGVDRTVHAFDAIDGKRIWTLPRPVGDALGLVQHGVLAPYRNVLVAGLGPKLALIDSLRGIVQQEVAVATPRGTNEVERLADLVGPAARSDSLFCVRAYQASVGCVDAARGNLVWSKTLTGLQSAGGDATMVVAGDGRDRLTAWKTTSGDTLWSHERFMFRGLGGVVVTPRAVVVGDAEGVLHVLDRASGETLQQLPTEGGPVIGAPVVVGNTLVVVKRSGAVLGVSIE